jgi:SEC-C motif-containing protein
MTDSLSCPCESGAGYAACCDRYLDGGAVPATAAQLMRSRYAAYVFGREDYLLRTWHATTRPPELRLADEPVKWLGLKVLHTQAGGVGDGDGVIEFVARYKVRGKAARLHETSRFVREGGKWLYIDGTQI